MKGEGGVCVEGGGLIKKREDGRVQKENEERKQGKRGG